MRYEAYAATSQRGPQLLPAVVWSTTMKNLLSVSAIALGLALATTCANAQTAPKAKAAAKAPNHEAMMKPCRASTKDMYTGDQRVFTYGYCVSKLPHAGNQVAGR
jgi:hypothetical protein